jgi:hypothetical protein
MAMERSVAYKVWISDIFSSEYIKQEGFNPNYIVLDGNNVSRVNILATVAGKFLSDDGNYGAITLDDGTETIRMKAFGPDVVRITNVEVGHLVRAVGKIKEYNNERYLAPDFAKTIDDPNWVIVQKLELGKPKEPIEQTEQPMPTLKEEPTPATETPVAIETPTTEAPVAIETPATETPAEVTPEPTPSTEDMPNFIEIIAKLDTGEGADTEAVIGESKMNHEEAKNMIVNLLKDGEIYEPRKGKLKVL